MEASMRPNKSRPLRDLSKLSPFSSVQGHKELDRKAGLREMARPQEPSANSDQSTASDAGLLDVRKLCRDTQHRTPPNSGSWERFNSLAEVTGRLSGHMSSYSSAFSPVPSIARIPSYSNDPASPQSKRSYGADPGAPRDHRGLPPRQSGSADEECPARRLYSAPAVPSRVHVPQPLRFPELPPPAWQAMPPPEAGLAQQLSEANLRALLLQSYQILEAQQCQHQLPLPPPRQPSVNPELLRSLQMLQESQQLLAMAMSNIRHIPSDGLDATVQRHKRKLADMGLNVTRKVEDILARGEDFALRTTSQRCSICGTDTTPVWRRAKGCNSELVCNACGLKKRRMLMLSTARRPGKKATPADPTRSGMVPEALIATALEPRPAVIKADPTTPPSPAPVGEPPRA